MSHIAYVNGQYVNHADAAIHIEDRGYQFADGVYEYAAFFNGVLLDAEPHLKRLKRSLDELAIDTGHTLDTLPFIIRELIAKNHRQSGAIYIQVSRGTAKRDHAFPGDVPTNVVVTLRGGKMVPLAEAQKGVKVITMPENRWNRCDIKSIALLANVLTKQEAISQGAKETWLYRQDGSITEGSVSNAFLIKDNVIHTHPLTESILPGITRNTALTMAKELGIQLKEEAFNLLDIKEADEAFTTSTSVNVQPVTQIDDNILGDGTCGPICKQLMSAFSDYIFKQTGKQW